MALFNKFDQFTEDLGKAVHDFSSDVIKIMLVNVQPSVTDAEYADMSEVLPGSGYSTGGTAVAVTWGQVSGLAKLLPAGDVTFLASGGSIGPFQWAVVYNSTPAIGPLIGWWDYGSSLTLLDGQSLLVDLDETNGIVALEAL